MTEGTPSPTPTPDPWAARFSADGPRILIGDADRGPWGYRDETLSVYITMPQEGLLKNRYYLAEIYTRGPVPQGVFYTGSNKRKTALPYVIARQNQAVFAITADYLTCSYNPKGVMIRGGKVYYEQDTAPTMAFLPSGEMRVYAPGQVTAQELLAQGVKDSFAFGPTLLTDGKPDPGMAKTKLSHMAMRTAVGQAEPGHYFVIVTTINVTLENVATLLQGLGCTSAYNLDGGFSASMVFMGEQLNKNQAKSAVQRSLPDMLVLGRCSAVPGEKDPVYGNGISLHRQFRPKPTDGQLLP